MIKQNFDFTSLPKNPIIHGFPEAGRYKCLGRVYTRVVSLLRGYWVYRRRLGIDLSEAMLVP